jgi:hypothetical protein
VCTRERAETAGVQIPTGTPIKNTSENQVLIGETGVSGGSTNSVENHTNCTGLHEDTPNLQAEPTSNQQAFPALPADLAEISAAWPKLPDALKAGILAMVRASMPNAGGSR